MSRTSQSRATQVHPFAVDLTKPEQVQAVLAQARECCRVACMRCGCVRQASCAACKVLLRAIDSLCVAGCCPAWSYRRRRVSLLCSFLQSTLLSPPHSTLQLQRHHGVPLQLRRAAAAGRH